MEIQEIKQRLTLANVLQYYGLKPDKSLRLRCPFHDDKTPSLQVYYKTHTAYCFSSNCKTHGKSMDVIDFIMHKESITKHAALHKAKELIAVPNDSFGKALKKAKPTYNTPTKSEFLTKMFTYFKNAVHNSKPAREYIEKRELDYKKLEIGYNAGQFHHGKRKDPELIKQCLEHGLLLDLGLTARTGNVAYKPFGKWGIVFALRNKKHEITGLYFRSTLNDKNQRHFYLKNRQGLYPNYPKPTTRRLILTESIIDAASLLLEKKITSNYQILALYGTNGLTKEHTEAISQLKELEEIIFFLNGDEAGVTATENYGKMLKADYPKLTVSKVEVPKDEDVNSLLQGHSTEILHHLINTRKECDFFFSTGGSLSVERKKVACGGSPPTEEPEQAQKHTPSVEKKNEQSPSKTKGLNTSNPYNLKYNGNTANYQIKGFKTQQLDSLKITLNIQVSC